MLRNCIVAGRGGEHPGVREKGTHQNQAGGDSTDTFTISSCCSVSADSFLNESRSLCASAKPQGRTARNVTSHNVMPQLAASSFGISKTWSNALIVASCEQPPTPGNCTRDPIMLKPMRISTLAVLISCMGAP